jgi:hypothetical protein
MLHNLGSKTAHDAESYFRRGFYRKRSIKGVEDMKEFGSTRARSALTHARAKIADAKRAVLHPSEGSEAKQQAGMNLGLD